MICSMLLHRARHCPASGRIEGSSTLFAAANGFPAASIPSRPTPSRPVECATGEQAGRLRAELVGVRVGTVIAFGEQERRAVHPLCERQVVRRRPRCVWATATAVGGRLRIADHAWRSMLCSSWQPSSDVA